MAQIFKTFPHGSLLTTLSILIDKIKRELHNEFALLNVMLINREKTQFYNGTAFDTQGLWQYTFDRLYRQIDIDETQVVVI